eukprot:Seg1058.9 transcript_id=Seg1058.9/GoldUCD/mRNA.D3Y31 product="Mediator of RNA polymerase II transcription subunit 7" protein_id=Seg1058.9/GoldUCD/D3Y31
MCRIKMAAEKEQNEGTSNEESVQLSFPLPPVKYYKQYTDANIKNNTAPAPPKLITGNYSMFGDAFDTNEDIIRPLEAQGIPRLYSCNENYDILAEMKKINHSILVNFLELLDVLIDSPSQEEREMKLDDINVLFINLHHLINEFRPHQARETLRVMLRRQKTQRLDTAEKLSRHIEKAKAVLRNCQSNLTNTSPVKQHPLQQQSSDVEMQDPQKPLDMKRQERDENVTDNRLMCEIVDNLR